MITVVILTIERNIECAHKVQKHLETHAFPKPKIRIYPSVPKHATNHDIHLSLCLNHYDILQSFSQSNTNTNGHLIVCEDDCEFIGTNKAFPIIKRCLNFLDKHHPEWTTFHIGHCPLGPIFGTGHSEIVYSMVPYMAHCYAVNGRQLKKLLLKYPNKREWKRPNAIEGWLWVPWKQKFAAFPTLATQNRMPKEVKNVSVVNKLGLTRSLQIVEQTMMYSLSGIALIVLLVIVIRLLLRKRKRV